MSITASELLFFGALNGTTSQGPVGDDTSPIGGDIDLAWCPSFTQIAQASGVTAKVQVASSGTLDGTKKLVVVGRDFTGALVTETIPISGTANTFSIGSQQWQRLLKCYVTANDGTTLTVPTGTITVKDNAATPNILGTIGGPGLSTQYGFFMIFEQASSDPFAGKTRYAVLYIKNSDVSLTLTNATVTMTSDASSTLNIAIASALGSLGAAGGNRLTAPTGIGSFSGVGTPLSVPNSQKLTAGQYVAIVIKQTLAGAATAQSNPFAIQLSGNTI